MTNAEVTLFKLDPSDPSDPYPRFNTVIPVVVSTYPLAAEEAVRRSGLAGDIHAVVRSSLGTTFLYHFKVTPAEVRIERI